MTMTIGDNQAKLLNLIQEGLAYNKLDDNKVELYENALVAAGLSKQQITLGLRKLAKDKVTELQQVFFAPERTISSYETDAKYKVPADDFYKIPVYVLHINRKKLESLPSVSAAMFVDDEAAIYFGNQKVGLPPHRGEHLFCRAMFEYKPNEAVSWDVVYETMTEGRETGEHQSKERNYEQEKRTVYDTLLRLNKRVADTVGVNDLFGWQGKTIKRTR